MYTTLIAPAELARHIADPDWAVLDCRFDLARPEWGASSYAASHIRGALYAHLDRDLSGSVTAQNGRHPLPSTDAFAATLERWGIDGKVQVVAYDQGNGAYASRLWWLLRWMGHSQVAVLDGGFAAWQQAGLPTSAELVARPPRRFARRPTPASIVTTDELVRAVAGGELTRGQLSLVDARGADRFAGQNETLDPVAGHVPGARNHPFTRNLGEQGRFLPAEELRVRWLETLDGQTPERTIAMCGSGVTACHNLLSLEIAGLPGARLFAGSWSEWIRDAARPVERGP